TSSRSQSFVAMKKLLSTSKRPCTRPARPACGSPLLAQPPVCSPCRSTTTRHPRRKYLPPVLGGCRACAVFGVLAETSFESRLIKLLTSAVGAQPPRLGRDENRRISHGTTNDQICLTTNNFFRKRRMITTTE